MCVHVQPMTLARMAETVNMMEQDINVNVLLVFKEKIAQKTFAPVLLRNHAKIKEDVSMKVSSLPVNAALGLKAKPA